MHLSRYPESTRDKARLTCSAHIASFFHLPVKLPLQTVCHEHLSVLWHGLGGGLWLLACLLPSALTELGYHLRHVSQYYFILHHGIYS